MTHALYEPRELEKVRAEYSTVASSQRELDREPAESAVSPASAVEPAGARAAPRNDVSVAGSNEEILELRAEIEALRQELVAVRKDLNDLWSQFR